MFADCLDNHQFDNGFGRPLVSPMIGLKIAFTCVSA